ncbi:phospholipase D/Transphosphatidylase [Aggregatibacter actinomycetemcomitans NUM4039]|nr:phospholipase D/Transphosphatidylase [Aggregatibacter actinomycetemcomitans NUM4039]
MLFFYLKHFLRNNDEIGSTPLQDVSAIVTGQVLWDINHNFCQSWDRKSNKQWGSDMVETDLTVQRNNFSREHYSYENNFFVFCRW